MDLFVLLIGHVENLKHLIWIRDLAALLDKVKNADIDVVIPDNKPAAKYCRISEVSLFLQVPPSNHIIRSWKEVFKIVPCP
jgi:hypothetical protein